MGERKTSERASGRGKIPSKKNSTLTQHVLLILSLDIIRYSNFPAHQELR
jgi:hypothetical protein